MSDRSGGTPDRLTRFNGRLFSNDYIDVAGSGGHQIFTVHGPVSLTTQNGHLLQTWPDDPVVHHIDTVHGPVYTQKLLLNPSFYDSLHIEVTRATPNNHTSCKCNTLYAFKAIQALHPIDSSLRNLATCAFECCKFLCS